MTDKILEIAKKVRVSKQTIQSETGKIVYEEFSFNSEQLETFVNLIRAECQKDAERYRWLMNDCDGNKQDDLFQWMARNVFQRSYIDEAIDSAMSEKG